MTSGTPTAPQSPYTPTSGKGTVSKDIVGSAIEAARRVTLKGTLSGTLTADGKPTLMSKGKTVSSLKAGRYKFVITDQDPKGSFIIQAVKKRSTDLTGVEFVGKRSATVTLKAGRWMYYSDLGKAHYFLVTG
jgi:hypothetical protein